MINTIVVDKNDQSRELLINNLNNIKKIEILYQSDEFPKDIQVYSESTLVIFDISQKNSREIFQKIEYLKERFEKLIFIATSYEINSSLVSETLSRGVCDFLLKPILPNVLETSIKKNVLQEIRHAKTISIFSNKGGVGKTTFAINLAYEMWKNNQDRICILDLSFNNENVAGFLNLKPKYDIDYILSNIEGLNENLLLPLITKYKDSKVYVLEAKDRLESKIKYTSQTINKIINSLKNIFDYIIIDTSPILSENNISVFNCSDIVLFLTIANKQSAIGCQKTCELFDKINYNDDKIRLVINRYIDNQELALYDIEKATNRKTSYTIPNNYLTLTDAMNMYSCVGETNPQSNIAKAYKRIAIDLLETDYDKLNKKTKYNHGIFNLLRKMGE